MIYVEEVPEKTFNRICWEFEDSREFLEFANEEIALVGEDSMDFPDHDWGEIKKTNWVLKQLKEIFSTKDYEYRKVFQRTNRKAFLWYRGDTRKDHEKNLYVSGRTYGN